MRKSSQVVFITGATSGIGRCCAVYLHQRGHRVYGAGRGVQQEHEFDFQALRMDVNEETSVQQAVNHVLEREGRLDVLINSAGIAASGAAEEVPDEAARQVMQTNFWGAHRMCRMVLPGMRQRKQGLIVNISSIGGLVAIPFQAFYSAAKFALEGYTESLRMEVAPWNIHVVLVEPGNFKTAITQNRKCYSDRSSPYRHRLERAEDVMASDEQSAPEPEAVARLVERLMHSRKPRLRYRCGRFLDTLAPTVKTWLPQSWFQKIIQSYYDRE
ncbi:MAG: SDR family oxidoreductase [candidate division KSB1 bacterium]|nr:SDR family oxidoreductase [candidate division KSB1 bacterium]